MSNKRHMTRMTAIMLALALGSAALANHHTIAERIANDSRPAAEQARDAGRKPAEVLEFLGVEAGMDVIDIMAAGGWYTEVLSYAVAENGSVAAQNPPWILQFRDGANDKAMSQRLAGNRLPNVSRLDVDFAALDPNAGQFDMALSALNFHDVYNRDGHDAAVAMLESIKAVLKPGGVFGILDHAGDEGADNASLHRIAKARVIEAAQDAGFVVEAESEVLSSGVDDHTQGVFSDGLRGKTDRFVLRLRKPAG